MTSLALAIRFICFFAATPATVAAEPVTLFFDLMAHGISARCGVSLGELGRDKKVAVLRDARFYLQDVALRNEVGNWVPLDLDENEWQSNQVALLDFEDATGKCAGGTADTNYVVTGMLPDGKYTGLQFTLGVPQEVNHSSSELAAPPLDLASMSWGWQAGRKFAKIEIDPNGGIRREEGSRATTWFLHLGSTGCVGNPLLGVMSCLRANRVPISLKKFDPKRQQVVLDLVSLFQESHLSEDRGGAAGCMSSPSDPECVGIFTRLGLSLSDGRPVASGKSSSVFSVKPKP